MAEINDQDLLDLAEGLGVVRPSPKVYDSEPFTPEPADNPADGVIAVKFHDRDGVDYEVAFCDPGICHEENVTHVQVVAYLAGIPLVFPPLGDPDRFGKRPRGIGEALAWTANYLQYMKDQAAARGLQLTAPRD